MLLLPPLPYLPAASSISKTVTNEDDETPNINAALATGGSITGKVIDPEGDGIKGIYVDLVDQTTEGLVYQTKTTGDNGGYNFTGINKGSYKLRFYAKGYLGKWYINETEFKNADLVIVNDQEVTTVFDVVLTKLGSISGRVTGANGAGLTGLIELFNLDYQSVAQTNTDDCGYYKFEDLQSGSYKVVFYTLCEEAWYNNKRDFESANAVTVAAPNETKGINIAYPASSCYNHHNGAANHHDHGANDHHNCYNDNDNICYNNIYYNDCTGYEHHHHHRAAMHVNC